MVSSKDDMVDSENRFKWSNKVDKKRLVEKVDFITCPFRDSTFLTFELKTPLRSFEWNNKADGLGCRDANAERTLINSFEVIDLLIHVTK